MKRWYFITAFLALTINILAMWDGRPETSLESKANKKAEQYHREQMEKACKQFEKNKELRTLPKNTQKECQKYLKKDK